MKLIPIFILFFMGFIGGGLIEYGIIPVHTKILIELCVYVLLIFSFLVKGKSKKPYQIHLLSFWALLFFSVLISAMVNGYFNFSSISSLRFLFRYYVFYIALINLELDDESILKINIFLLVLFLLQLPVIAFNFSIYGVDERTIGIYGKGGGLTTMIPVVMVSYLMSYYFFWKRSLWLIFFSLLFIVWGVIGAKAALFFIFPVNFIALYYLCVIKFKGFSFSRDILHIGILGIFILGVMGLFLYSNPRMNPERTVGGSVDFQYAFEFAERYETRTRYYDERIGIGRTSTTILTLKQLREDGFSSLLFGYGPGILTVAPFGGKTFDEKVFFIVSGYGITGMIYIWVEYGFFGALIFCLIFIAFSKNCWQWYGKEITGYWKAFSTGTLVFCIFNLFIFITYNRLPVADDTILPVFYYAMAIVHIKLSYQKKTQISYLPDRS